MDYSSQFELYKALIPVFKVKQRLLKRNKINLTNDDIWKYLVINKWKNSHNLTIFDIVNDIITIDENLIFKYIEHGGK